ncbi:MAG TPA: DEAD/DEAH box helicase [Caulobacteraceae bacterium]|jgi:ATP-dependent RNA helicase SUPV3L1/SUV3
MPLNGHASGDLTAILGPTNTGKTHLAVERMLGHASGMIGLPLRLLAREIYDRVAAVRGARSVALITGEEKITPPRPAYFVATVEAMPLGAPVEFVAVDEIQLAADPERGHVFTDRLLNARGRSETMLLGAATMAPLVRRLLPGARIVSRERFSALAWAGGRKVSRLPRRSAVVAFSAEEVYAIAELIRRQRGGAAVVMGSLSPRTRNAQVALFQSGEVDFLVATDAIGMGLNMDVDHVAFAGLAKFDGKRRRPLHAHEVGQIAGRAGRFLANGTFGVTAGCELMDPELVEAVENHRFDPVEAALWRNSVLDFANLPALLASLAAPPRRMGLKASEEALDERVLRQLAADEDVAKRASGRLALARLWDACQTPDFRKTTLEDHLRLTRDLFLHLTGAAERVPEDWMAEGLARIDRLDGEIEALSTRLAGVRTLAYVAHRPDWLADPAHWRERTRALEDRLSDTLHEKLMARFVDQRTSALIRGLGARRELLAGVGADGLVTVEGFAVGRLSGLAFNPARGASVLEQKALRRAAERVVGPEINRRLGGLAAERDDAFAIGAGGLVLWRGQAAGVVTLADPFGPIVRLLTELGAAPARERAARRLEAFATAETRRRWAPLWRLSQAVREGGVQGLARGVAWRLVEAGGTLARREVETEVAALSRAERRQLRRLGVRIGAFALFVPSLLTADAAILAAMLVPGDPRAEALQGRVRLAGIAAPAVELEALAEALRAAPSRRGGRLVSRSALAAVGIEAARAETLLRALGFAAVGRGEADGSRLWRRRREAPVKAAQPHSPFAILAGLEAAPPRRRRRRAQRA